MSDSPTAPSGPEIARRAQESKILYLALNLAMPSLLHPELPVLQTLLAINGQPPTDDLPVELAHGVGSPGQERLVYGAREVLTKASQLRGEIIGHDLMAVGMLLGATRIGDMIHTADLYQRDVPLLQFARHFRNACAHGDRWEFRPGEPRTPATCRGLTLTADLHGHRASMTTISPRLYVEFLDDITNHFVPGLVPEPTRETP